MTTDIQNLRQEHADHVIGPELEHLLARVVRATARAYPPAEYSDAGVWDSAALADALQDWVEIRLLSRGDLSKMLLRYQSVGALRGALTRSFEQFLTNRRRRTSATNLYQRTTKMLREDSDSFAKLGRADRSHEQLWTLAAGPATEPSRLEAPALVAIASQLSDEELEVVRYGHTSLKSSPILRERKLREFLVHLLDRADGAIDQATIAEVMRRRFGLFELQAVALEAEVEGPATELRAVERDAVVSSVLVRLGQERLEALRSFHAGGEEPEDPVDLPDAVSETITLVAQYAESVQDAEEIYDALVESLF